MVDERLYRLDHFELYLKARAFRRKIYGVIKQLPRAERYCLDPQMRKAVVSITNNIAEGHGRWHYQENIQFCRIARGSAEEIIDDLSICLDEKYAAPDLLTQLEEEAYELIGRINGYIAYLKNTKQGEPADRANQRSPATRGVPKVR